MLAGILSRTVLLSRFWAIKADKLSIAFFRLKFDSDSCCSSFNFSACKLCLAEGRMAPYLTPESISLSRTSSSSRSEEHTSELQSRGHLVCRLLLESKKALH